MKKVKDKKPTKSARRRAQGMVLLMSGRWVSKFDAYLLAVQGGDPEKFVA